MGMSKYQEKNIKRSGCHKPVRLCQFHGLQVQLTCTEFWKKARFKIKMDQPIKNLNHTRGLKIVKVAK